MAAKGSSTATLHHAFSGCHFTWTFVFADVKMPLLGADLFAITSRLHASKVNAITDFPHPVLIKQLQEFVIMISYCFIPNLAHVIASLYAALSKKPKIFLSETQQE